MELRKKGTAQNVTNIKSNVCFCYKRIINIYVQLQIFIDLFVRIMYVVRQRGIIHESEGFGIFCCLDFVQIAMQCLPIQTTAGKRRERGYVSDNHLNETGNFPRNLFIPQFLTQCCMSIGFSTIGHAFEKKNNHFIVNSTINRLQIASLSGQKKSIS